ncbi:MAG: FecR domain-containing protein [Candidatus Riflebacteria bacterium]|nr:FecR domain-containing protein [Candidatus Riflebacteria bacterium]
MACETFRNLLEAAADGSLEAAERSRLDLHLPQCGQCRTDLTSLQRAVAQLRRDVSVEPPPGLADTVMRRVLSEAGSAVRRRPARAPAPSRLSWLSPRLGALLLGGSLAVAASLAVFHGPSQVQPAPGATQVAQTTAEPGRPHAEFLFTPHGAAQTDGGLPGKWQDLAAKTALTAGTHVRTLAGGLGELALANGTRVQLGESTTLLLRHRDDLVLPAGHADVTAAGPIAIETPHAAVRVLGTRFSVAVSGPDGTRVLVREGSVVVVDTATGHRQELTAPRGCHVPPARPSRARAASAPQGASTTDTASAGPAPATSAAAAPTAATAPARPVPPRPVRTIGDGF